jgi:Flp pilus assembly protein TadG
MPTSRLLDRARTHHTGCGQVGSVTVEMVVIFPAVLLLIFGIVQAGVWYHGRTLAMLAAQDGLRTAQALDGTAAAGEARTTASLNATGATGFVTSPNVTVTRTPTSVTVTVTARSVALLPGTGLPITQRATGPVERIPEDTP